MTQERWTQLFKALGGSEHETIPVGLRSEIDGMLAEDTDAVVKLIDQWIRSEREYYFQWASHKENCDLVTPRTMIDGVLMVERVVACTCGLAKAMEEKNKT